jgi:xylan 1,4-beta-xylosidase
VIAEPTGDHRAADLAAATEWLDSTLQRDKGDPDLAVPALAAPVDVTVRPGRGQVTLDWQPVDGAAGYVVRRAGDAGGRFEPLEIGEPWVRSVPHPPLTDTTGEPGRDSWYTVAAVATVDDRAQPQSPPVPATPAVEGDASCRIAVDTGAPTGPVPRPWRPMIGAEHLSQLEYGEGPGGRPIGEEFAEALRMAHDELGTRAVRAHGILLDELGTYRELDGRPVHDFGGIHRIYDRVLDLGMRPVVEVGFMPRDLARDPTRTVFAYEAVISPPKDWDRWESLVGDLAADLVRRYGRDEVRSWAFEIWNEANLGVFWSGSREEYFELYERSARAIKAVDRALPVGGPGSAAVGWIDDMLDAADRRGAPLDFLSTHCYGNAPLDLRPIAARHGRPDLPLWWTEWGAHAGHFSGVHDSAWSAAYLTRGMASAMGRMDALSYWTVSDHFEELGRPPSLLHGGFGLLTVGNLRKPRWWALWMLERLGRDRLPAVLDGDGAGDMVGAVASSDPDGRVALVVWNGTVDVTKSGGDPLLDRDVDLTVTGLPASRYRLRHRRVDEQHSNVNRAWAQLSGSRPWPDEGGWAELRAADHLDDLVEPSDVEPQDGRVRLTFDLPMPSVSLLELVPAQ